MTTRRPYQRRAREPFRTLADEHRRFDIAEILRTSDVFGEKSDKKLCMFIQQEDKIVIITDREGHTEFEKITKSLNKITECLSEINIVARNVISTSVNGLDYISGLNELLRIKYERNLNNFAVLTTSNDTIDLSARTTGVKGVLRWALEKYSIFNLAKISIDLIIKLCQNIYTRGRRSILELLQDESYYLPNLVFGSQRLRSSISFWIEGGKVRYAVSPSPKVSKIFLEHGVPVRCHESVLRYFLAVAVAMLNPLNCYMGEPAVPIVRRGSCGESARVIMYSRDFDYDCGRSYGEELINVLTCKLLNKLEKVMCT